MAPRIRKNAPTKNLTKVSVVIRVRKKNTAPIARDAEPNHIKSLHITNPFFRGAFLGRLMPLVRFPEAFLASLTLPFLRSPEAFVGIYTLFFCPF